MDVIGTGISGYLLVDKKRGKINKEKFKDSLSYRGTSRVHEETDKRLFLCQHTLGTSDFSIFQGNDIILLHSCLAEPKNSLSILTSSIKQNPYRLNSIYGTFSACIYDTNRETLYITRDPIGKKSLFYFNKNGIFAFSSDIRSLCLLRKKETKPNKDYLETYLLKAEHTSGSTKYRGINRVKPGEVVEVDIGGGGVKKTIWRSLEAREHLGKQEAYDKFRKTYKSVAKQHVAHGASPVIQISGGVDSTSMASVIGNLAVNTDPIFYSVTYRRERPDESAMLDKVEEYAGINIKRFPYSEIEVTGIGNTADEFQDRLYNPFHFMHRPIFDSLTDKTQPNRLMTGIGADVVMGAPFYKYKYLHYLKNLSLTHIVKEALVSFNHRWFTDFLYSLINCGIRELFNDLTSLHADIEYPSTPFYINCDINRGKQAAREKLFSGNIIKDLIIYSIYNDPPHTEETVDKISTSMNINVVHLYYDRRLLEVILNTKIDTLFNTGRAKNLIKESLSADIPYHIYRRKTKSGYDEILADEIRNRSEYIEKLIHDSQFNASFINWPDVYSFFSYVKDNHRIEEQKYSELREFWSLTSILDWYENNF